MWISISIEDGTGCQSPDLSTDVLSFRGKVSQLGGRRPFTTQSKVQRFMDKNLDRFLWVSSTEQRWWLHFLVLIVMMIPVLRFIMIFIHINEGCHYGLSPLLNLNAFICHLSINCVIFYAIFPSRYVTGLSQCHKSHQDFNRCHCLFRQIWLTSDSKWCLGSRLRGCWWTNSQDGGKYCLSAAWKSVSPGFHQSGIQIRDDFLKTKQTGFCV